MFGITPVLLSHDPSEINLICWFGVQYTFLIIINVENSCAACFVETTWYIFARFFDEQKIKKNSTVLK